MRSPADMGRGRPLAQERPLNVVPTDSHDSTDPRPRCRRCGHVVFAEASIATLLGRDCRRALIRALRGASA